MAFCGTGESGIGVKDLCRNMGFPRLVITSGRGRKFGGMSVSDAKRLRELETENARLKKLLAESVLENEVAREALRKKMVTVSARRELVRFGQARGLSERHALRMAGMSASLLRYGGGRIATRRCASALWRWPIATATRLRMIQSAPASGRFGGQPEAGAAAVPGRVADGAAGKRKKVALADRQPLLRAKPAERSVVGGFRV